MKKRLTIGLVATGTALALLPLFAAFEAHVVNVTAKIENALTVPVKYLEFGTVFPQEYLVKDIDVSLSQSFIAEGRVDDVEYFIRQKPKCAITTENGQQYDNTVNQSDGAHAYTGTGHVVPNLETTDPTDYTIDCGPAPRELAQGETWGLLPSLCPYLSKHENTEDENGQINEDKTDYDQSVPAFHVPFTVDAGGVHWTDAEGYLSKNDQDTRDNWVIDLAVPCFGGYCAQDWADFVHGKNETANPDLYTQPIANEHKVFGCDLWFEVSGVSCNAQASTQTIVSDTTNTVPENANAPAEALSFLHAAWTASIPGATWIWENDPVQNPGSNETFSFEKQFTPAGTVSSATLDIATDNTYQVYVNNVLTTCASADENNFQLGTQDTCNLLPYLQAGTNTLKVVVSNIGINGSTPPENPAGLLYKLSIAESVCTEE